MAQQRINRKEFPHNNGIRARLEAVIAGCNKCSMTLAMVKEFALPQLPEKTRATLAKQIDEALAAHELALQAIAGDE